MTDVELTANATRLLVQFLCGIAGEVEHATGRKLVVLLGGNQHTQGAYNKLAKPLAEGSDDENLQGALRSQVENALAEDEGFRTELDTLLS